MIKIVLIIAAYLFGSIPSALIIGKKYYNKDIRLEGSGNLGGTNAGRVLGRNAGILVSFLDVLKVFIPTMLARFFFNFEAPFDTAALIGIVALVGHCYPIFANFKGGKGVSSYLGIGLVLNPLISVIVFIVWTILKKVTNYVSLSSIIAVMITPFIILSVYKFEHIPAFFLMLAGALFIVFLHRANIKRLLNGTENKIRK